MDLCNDCSSPFYYSRSRSDFFQPKEPELTQIWDEYEATWPWGSPVSLHNLSLGCPCCFSPDQGSTEDSTTDHSVRTHAFRVCVGSTIHNSWVQQIDMTLPGEWENHLGNILFLIVFPSLPVSGNQNDQKYIVGHGTGLFWPCLWLRPVLAFLSLFLPANIYSDYFPKSWSDENVLISLLLPQLCLRLFLFCFVQQPLLE